MNPTQTTTNIRFGYFRVSTNRGPGYICIAMTRPPKGTQGELCHLGISFCSPKDCFNKKMARQIAEGRLFKNPLTIEDIPGPSSQNMRTALQIALKDSAPSWAKKTASRIYFGLNPNIDNMVDPSNNC
jgi:hypothetical protein